MDRGKQTNKHERAESGELSNKARSDGKILAMVTQKLLATELESFSESVCVDCFVYTAQTDM
jgi:hypothetical protein